MKIELKKNFEKQFAQLRRNEQSRVIACLKEFETNPDSPSLRRHALKGGYQGYKSISAGGDLRLHYFEKDDRITFVFVSVGSHSNLYKNGGPAR
jgi:addiction module RelE/StbE family toxin